MIANAAVQFGSTLSGLFARPAVRAEAPSARETGADVLMLSRTPDVDKAYEEPSGSRKREPMRLGYLQAAALALESGLDRIVVLTASDVDDLACIDLVRHLARHGSSSVLVDLTGEDLIARRMGLFAEYQGLKEFDEGLATFADIIHRDHYTRAHVVPSSGFSLMGGKRQSGLELLLSAVGQAYDFTVVACSGPLTEIVDGLLGETSALLVDACGRDGSDISALQEEFEAYGIEDLLLIEASRRGARAEAR